MKEKIKYLNIFQIISNILLLGLIIAIIITNNSFIYRLFWCVVPISIISNVYFIGKWSKRGVNIDKKKSNEVSRSLDDSTTIMLVFYGLIYLGIMLVECFNSSITSNIYITIGFYVLTIVFELFMLVLVDSAIKETKQLIKETIKNDSMTDKIERDTLKKSCHSVIRMC